MMLVNQCSSRIHFLFRLEYVLFVIERVWTLSSWLRRQRSYRSEKLLANRRQMDGTQKSVL